MHGRVSRKRRRDPSLLQSMPATGSREENAKCALPVAARMTPLGWAAVALGALALVALVVLLRRLSRVEPDFSPLAPASPAPAPVEAPPTEPGKEE